MSHSSSPSATKFCHECGSSINAKAEICPQCGVRQAGTAAPGKKDRITAAILALFLGTLGVHHFYLGRPVLGILHICFCWFFFFPTIIGFIDGLIFLFMSDSAFNRKFNK